jgi:homoaconitase/3-isopropylmalate dehydratase large subunit
MRPNIRNILADCIERGARTALINSDDVTFEFAKLDSAVDQIEREVWLAIDDYFDFD